MAHQVENLPALQETWFQSLSLEYPLEEEMALTPVFLPGKSHRQRSLVGYSSKGYKESDTTEHIHTHKTRRGILLTVIISIAGSINYVKFCHHSTTYAVTQRLNYNLHQLLYEIKWEGQRRRWSVCKSFTS